ncbi:GSCOCG00006128001-RA-CDS [Cotesia congregata]|uniref:Similar to Aatf: Protein AATF (Mus musculus) n=1 Tax=Cotesia congregata TaxID=51543 RepID=A0A8J2HJW9_COTCN|nr:GSCOCG00006128001-RA-CDS [Cotesia congregata]CAG5100251.1 Similar to Aatf: Protein AATF (Mus musculus) [Cotesia congregata]
MSKAKKSSFAEELNSLLNVAPKPFESDEEEESTKAKVVDKFEESHSDDEQASSFRKKNVPLLDETDERYKGKKVTREEAFGEESASDQDDVEMESDEEEDDDEEEDTDNVDEDEVEGTDEDESDNDGDDDDDDEDEDEEKDTENPLYRDRSDNLFKNLVSNPQSEAEKGNCVKTQQRIWEKLLEIRIKLQPVVITSNKMPQHDVVKTLQTNPKFNKQKKETQNKLCDVLDNLLDLQQKLFKSFPETKNLLDQTTADKKIDNQDEDDEEICSDTEEEIEKSEEEPEEKSEEPPKKKIKRSLKDYEKIISDIHKKYTPYRNSVIQKWNDKTRVAAGKMNKNANQSVVRQIEFVLNDKSKLIKRTQLKRSEYEIVGKKSLDETDEDGRRVQEYDTEIYDDDDFYHQLLRELIEQKTSHITDPVELSRQFSKLQTMRKKLKRKIDTRATKGRRIRYNVHTNLVNFMPSITGNDTWTESGKTALYNSLFGKLKTAEVENN